MGPLGWIKVVFVAGKSLIDLWRMGRDVTKESDESEGTNPVKVREQAAGASANSEAKLVGKRR